MNITTPLGFFGLIIILYYSFLKKNRKSRISAKVLKILLRSGVDTEMVRAMDPATVKEYLEQNTTLKKKVIDDLLAKDLRAPERLLIPFGILCVLLAVGALILDKTNPTQSQHSSRKEDSARVENVLPKTKKKTTTPLATNKKETYNFIAGTVVDMRSGKGIKDAVVIMDGKAIGQTDSAGSFAIRYPGSKLDNDGPNVILTIEKGNRKISQPIGINQTDWTVTLP